MKEYERRNVPLAKKLRADMTEQERKLWYNFLNRYEPRFQRQKSIGKYIADFYCANAGLIVELDGGGHYTPEQKEADALRTKELEAMKVRVVRISNYDVDYNFQSVCEYIDRLVRENRRER